jgi:DNA-binding NarL/FixJ family response regulator
VKQFSKSLPSWLRSIVQLLAEGDGLKKLAARLNLKPKTIEFHKHQMMAAFNLKGNAKLAFALKQDVLLVNPEAHLRVLSS